MKIHKFLLTNLLVSVCLLACEPFPFPVSTEESKPAEDPSAALYHNDTIAFLRTPDERFDGLVDYPFEPRYVTVKPGNLRMHYIDEGPIEGKTILLLHGNPAWSYVVRKLVPPLVAKGYRVIAPDLIGFGKSDKPIDRSVHTYDNQEAWVTGFIRRLNLQGIHLHVQDWGGLIGLRVAIRNEWRFATVTASNTYLPTGELTTDLFKFWRDSVSQVVPSYSIVLQTATFTTLTPEEQAAYDAPYPSEEYKAGPRELPLQVPVDPDDPEARENQWLLRRWTRWQKPFLTLFSEEDNISADFEQVLIDTIPGAAGQLHAKIPQTRHFIREDAPEELVERLSHFIESNQ